MNSYHGRGASAAGIVVIVIILFVLVGGVWWVYSRMPDEMDVVDTSVWQEYRSEEFGFTIRYPQNWQVTAFSDDPLAPGINIYPATVDEQPPFTHHSAVTQVSIFPHGIGTEGVFGEQHETNTYSIPHAQTVREFTLVGGTPWAVMASDFSELPPSWQEWGFVWAAAEIEGVVMECVRDNSIIPLEDCSPPATGTLVRRGTVDRATWQTITAILESFAFVDEPAPTAPEISYTNADPSIIVVNEPQPGDRITSPLVVTGAARGMWYFEATFPLTLTNWDGLIIAEGYATAQDEWMTEELVPFEGTLTFTPDTTVSDRGTLILHRSNASGLPEHDAAVEMTVRFE